jgi:hypothetical protein
MAEAEEVSFLGCYQSVWLNILEDSSLQQPRWQNLGSRRSDHPPVPYFVKISKSCYTAF